MIETFSKLRMKLFYLIIGNYKKLSTNVTLNGEEGKKKGCKQLLLFSPMCSIT